MGNTRGRTRTDRSVRSELCLSECQGKSRARSIPPTKIVILGAGVVGSNAAQMAVGSGVQVLVLDRNVDALRRNVLKLADQGHRRALQDDPHLRAGRNVFRGKITCREVAEALHHPHHDRLQLVAG